MTLKINYNRKTSFIIYSGIYVLFIGVLIFVLCCFFISNYSKQNKYVFMLNDNNINYNTLNLINQLFPQNQLFNIGQAQIYEQRKNYLKAIKYYQKALRDNPKNTKLYEDVAYNYLKAKQYRNFLDYRALYLKYNPKAFSQINANKEIVLTLDRLKKNSHNKKLLLKLAGLYLINGDYNNAYNEIIKTGISPDNAALQLPLKLLYYYQQKKRSKVFDMCQKYKSSFYCISFEGDIYYDQGMYDEALHYYRGFARPRDLIALNMDAIRYINRLSKIYEIKKMYSKADEYATISIFFQPNIANLKTN